jgi:hypothetical protein
MNPKYFSFAPDLFCRSTIKTIALAPVFKVVRLPKTAVNQLKAGEWEKKID